MTSSPSQFNELDIWYGTILSFNRRLVSIIRLIPSELGVNESHILAEVCQTDSVSAKALSLKLGIEKSILSRIISSLIKRKLLGRSASLQDRRFKQLEISSAGLAAVTEDRKIRNHQTDLSAAVLNKEDLCFFLRCHRLMADSANAAAVKSGPGEHPLEREYRRLTRAWGFIGRNCLGTRMSAEKCQVLYLVGSSSQGMPMHELCTILPMERSILSRLLSSLMHAGLIEKKNFAHDKRRKNIVLTAKGVVKHRENIALGGAVVQACQACLTDAERQRLLALYRVLAAQPLPDFAAKKVGIRRILKDEERRAARAFAIEQLIRGNAHSSAPESLFAAGSVSRAAYIAGQLVGVCEIMPSSEEWSLNLLLFGSRQDAEACGKQLLASALKEVFSRNPAGCVRVESVASFATQVELIGVGRDMGRGRVLWPKDLASLRGRALAPYCGKAKAH